MSKRFCAKWSAMGAALAWSWGVRAQDAAPIAVPPLPLDPTSQLLMVVLESGSLPVVLAFVVWQVSRGLSGWTPTIKVIHQKEEPWDGTERRRSSDR